MSTIEKEKATDQITAQTTPRLIVVNSSTSQGRVAVMLRLRPTLLTRVRESTVGPVYLIIEHALTRMLDELEQLPPGTMQRINAFNMDPSQADLAMIDQIPRRRQKKRKTVANDAASDDQARGRDNGKKREIPPPKN